MRKWQRAVLELLDGVEADLCPSAPKAARTALARLRLEVPKGTQKATWPQVEALLESKPYYRAATRRYLGARVLTDLTEALEALRELAEQGFRVEVADVVRRLAEQLRRHRKGTARAQRDE